MGCQDEIVASLTSFSAPLAIHSLLNSEGGHDLLPGSILAILDQGGQGQRLGCSLHEQHRIHHHIEVDGVSEVIRINRGGNLSV